MSTLKAITHAVSEFGKDASASLEQLGRSAGKGLDEAREGTGDALHTAATSVRTAGSKGSEAIDNLTAGVADRLDTTASYVEDYGLADMSKGLRKFCRRHLTASLAAAAVIGFLAGSALSRAAGASGRAGQRASEPRS